MVYVERLVVMRGVERLVVGVGGARNGCRLVVEVGNRWSFVLWLIDVTMY